MAPKRKSSALNPFQQFLQSVSKRRKTTMSATETVTAESTAVSKKYQKKNLRQHILDLPDTYIGAVAPTTETVWIAKPSTDDSKYQHKLTETACTVCFGLYKIVDEILTNALDHAIRTRHEEAKYLVQNIKISIDETKGCITVFNDGAGIPVVKHAKEHIWIPEMLFGTLLTSGNYNKKEIRFVGGKNGYGGNLCCIFSTKFVLETVDEKRHLKFQQTWRNNMSPPENPAKITKAPKSKPYTKITFWPDLKRFHLDAFNSTDTIALIRKRAYDLAGIAPEGVKIYLDKKRLPLTNFSQYAKLCGAPSKGLLDYKLNEKWHIIICPSPDGEFKQVSFVNGISTILGGKHVDYLMSMIGLRVAKLLNAKQGVSGIRSDYIRSNTWIFVNCLIGNPSFSNQTKERLTTPYKKFANTCDLPTELFEKIASGEIARRAKEMKQFKDKSQLSKTDGKKTSNIGYVPKLEDANWAGTKKSNQCTLMLVEGDSAKTFAVSGISIVGRDRYGIYPLRGVPLNVRQASKKRLQNNEEFCNLKKILGLQQNVEHKLSDLRYGKLMLLTDQDLDGSHIKGLILDMFATFWPNLLEQGFVVSMHTPLIKVFHRKICVASFYSQQDYYAWEAKQDPHANFKVKYYKGLGTSSAKEAKEAFRAMHVAVYETTPCTFDRFECLFSKNGVGWRKDWIKTWSHNKPAEVRYDSSVMQLDDFVDREYIQYALYANQRAIPSMVDGFKPSQRKVLYGMLKRSSNEETKVSILAGSIAASAAYHHGETSLCQAIIGMAQNFVGSNNIHFLSPESQVGTRLKGGADAASPRYAKTMLSPITRCIVSALDECLLNFQQEEGLSIEPEWYLPILPMILVNGAHGVGVGFSCHVPSFDPFAIIENLRCLLDGKQPAPLVPWVKGFQGAIYRNQKGKWVTEGVMHVDRKKSTVHITELPVQTWTDPYKTFLETSSDVAKLMTRIELGRYHNDTKICITLHCRRDILKNYDDEGLKRLLALKETTFGQVNNMHAFAPDGTLVHFKGPDEVLKAFFHFRRPYYEARRRYWIEKYSRQVHLLKEKAKFMEAFIKGDVNIAKQPDDRVLKALLDFKFDPWASNTTIEPPSVQENWQYYMDACIRQPVYNLNGPPPETKVMVVSDSKRNNPVAEITLGHFDHLLNTNIRSLTESRLNSLWGKIHSIEADMNSYVQVTGDDLWRQDLLDLEKHLRKSSVEEDN